MVFQLKKSRVDLDLLVSIEKRDPKATISSLYENTTAFIRIDNFKIESTDELKICGYRFGSRPGVSNQVDYMERKFYERSWSLRNLKRSGLYVNDLKTCYVSLIRPIFDYTSMVYNSLLTREQVKKLEWLQKRALRILLGNSMKYEAMLSKMDLENLEDRRASLVTRFLDKTLERGRFTERWFPKKKKHAYGTRCEELYIECKSNTEQMRNSPLNHFRRELNIRHNNGAGLV